MTISSPDVMDTTLFQDGQAAGSITPSDIRVLVDSATGIASTTQTGSYTAVLADHGTVVEMNAAGALNFNVPTNGSVAFDIGTVMEVYQMGAGQVTVVAVTPGTTTIRTATGTATTRAQYSTVSLRKRATDEWVLSGDLS